MNNDYELLIKLTETLDKNTPLIKKILENDKEKFSNNPEHINIVYNDVIDVAIPFDSIGVAKGETVEIFMANTDSGVKNTYLPQEILLSVTREY